MCRTLFEREKALCSDFAKVYCHSYIKISDAPYILFVWQPYATDTFGTSFDVWVSSFITPYSLSFYHSRPACMYFEFGPDIFMLKVLTLSFPFIKPDFISSKKQFYV